MKKSLFLSSFVLCLAFCAAAPAEPLKLRAGTYNIRNSGGDRKTENAWESRRADLVAQIRELELDVFGMQEVLPDQAAYLAENLPEFAYVGDHRGKDRKSDEASPVCYRKDRFKAVDSGTFWLSETPDVPASKSWKTCCTRVCSWLLLEEKGSGKRFCFANTHTDHASEEAREKGMLLVVERMRKFGAGVPVIFVGDHNCLENSRPARTVASLLTNTLYAAKSPAKGPWRTVNGWRYLEPEKEPSVQEALKLSVEERNSKDYWTRCQGDRIDYIYVSPEIRVLEQECHRKFRPGTKLYISDHYPVTAVLELP